MIALPYMSVLQVIIAVHVVQVKRVLLYQLIVVYL